MKMADCEQQLFEHLSLGLPFMQTLVWYNRPPFRGVETASFE